MSTTEDVQNFWLADSGASMHMTFRKDFFMELRAPKENHFDKIADDKMLPIVGTGTVKISEKMMGKHMEREM